MVSDEQLEQGSDDLVGSLSNGRGSWHLSVSATRPILVMNLLKSPTGHVTNISAQTLILNVKDDNPLVEEPSKPKFTPRPEELEPAEPEPTPPVEPDPDEPTPELDIPPNPVDMRVSAGINAVMVTWANPFEFYTNHSHAIVYRNTVDRFRTAVRIGTSPWKIFVDENVETRTTYYYWTQFESTAGVRGPVSESASDTTGTDPNDFFN